MNPPDNELQKSSELLFSGVATNEKGLYIPERNLRQDVTYTLEATVIPDGPNFTSTITFTAVLPKTVYRFEELGALVDQILITPSASTGVSGQDIFTFQYVLDNVDLFLQGNWVFSLFGNNFKTITSPKFVDQFQFVMPPHNSVTN